MKRNDFRAASNRLCSDRRSSCDEVCAPDLCDISYEGKKAADEPGKTCGEPDAPYTKRGEQAKEEGKAYSADDFDYAVAQREACVADAVQDSAADVDRAECEVEGACDAECVCTHMDDLGIFDEELHYCLAAYLGKRKNDEGEHGHDDHALCKAFLDALEISCT